MRACVMGLVTLLVIGGSATVGRGDDPLVPARRRKVMKTDREWFKLLSRDQYMVTRHKETEPAFTGRYWNNHARGYYACVCCGAFLFSSGAKFESGTGWPSFNQPLAKDRIDSELDYKQAEPRLEVMCNDCGAHLGHVFNDGPPPTGLRYCVNSASLKFFTEAQVKALLAKQKEAEKKAKEAEKKADSSKEVAKPDDPSATAGAADPVAPR